MTMHPAIVALHAVPLASCTTAHEFDRATRVDLPSDVGTDAERFAWQLLSQGDACWHEYKPPEETFDWWRKRIDEECEPFLRARYGELLWMYRERTTTPGVGRRALAAAADLVSCANAESSLQPKLRAKCLLRAARLFRELNQRDREEMAWNDYVDLTLRDHPPGEAVLIGGVVREILERDASHLLGAHQCKLVHTELATTMQRMRDTLSGAEMAILVELQRFHTLFIRASKQDVALLQEQLGLTCRAILACKDPGSPMMISMCLNDVRPLVEAVGERVLLGEIDAAIARGGPALMRAMKRTSVEQEFSETELVAIESEFITDNPIETLVKLTRLVLPDQQSMEQLARDGIQSSQVFRLMGHMTVDDTGRPIAHEAGRFPGVLTDADLDEALGHQLKTGIGFARMLAPRAIARHPRTLYQLVRTIEKLSPPSMRDRRQIGQIAFALLRRRWATATTLLVLRVEPLVRYIASLTGSPVFSSNDAGGINYAAIDGWLRKDAASDALGSPLYLLLTKVVFKDNGLRHAVAHGFCRDPVFNFGQAFIALSAVVLLGYRAYCVSRTVREASTKVDEQPRKSPSGEKEESGEPAT